MFKKLTHFLKEYSLHPFLLGLYFVFFQIKQAFILYNPLQIFLYIGITILAAILPYILIFPFLKNKKKAAVIGMLIMLTFFFFGNIRYELHGILENYVAFSREKYIISFILLLFILPVVFTKSKLQTITAYLNTLFIILILFELALGIVNYSQSRKWSKHIRPTTSVSHNKNVDNRPDIYHIVLDAYTSSEELKNNWLYHNTKLDTFLLNKGFFASNQAQSNSTATQISMAIELNMDYLPHLDSIVGNDLVSTSAYRLAIKNNKVVHSLKQMGYEIINLSIFDIDSLHRFHDMHYMPDATSLPRYLFRDCLIGWPQKEPALPFNGYTNQKLFRELEKIPDETHTKPIFVYAHLMMPHGPYYFDRLGNMYPDGAGMPFIDPKREYLEQLIYTNKLLMHAIEKIMSTSKTPPIIIIQGDHGSRLLREEGNHEEEYSMLARFHFPDKDYSMLNDSISPVNIYRVVFNKYFEGKYPMLPYQRTKGVKESH